jgi:hypothetical protein
VHFTWPGGTWGVPEPEEPPRQQHNTVLGIPETRADGFSVLAIENQSCALWAFPTADKADDPEIYQADLGDDDYGPWHPLGMRRSGFLEVMAVWNQANGGAVPSVVGQLPSTGSARLASSPVVTETPWFKVQLVGDIRVCVAGNDVYAWGASRDALRMMVRSLPLAWSDLE